MRRGFFLNAIAIAILSTCFLRCAQACSGDAQIILTATNANRSQNQLGALALNDALCKAASHHARNMAKFTVMAHDLPQADLPTLGDRLANYGADFALAAENIASGDLTSSTVVDAWMNSTGHRANILTPGYTQMGAASATDASGKVYYCQVFTGAAARGAASQLDQPRPAQSKSGPVVRPWRNRK